jgi:hypothetical protein
LQKRDKTSSYLNKYQTNKTSQSKPKINSYLTSGDLKTVSIESNDVDEYKSANKGHKYRNDRYLDQGNLNSNTIESIPDSPRMQHQFGEDYHQYCVVHKQLKYGNKNIDLARKSQISDPKEILYSKYFLFNLALPITIP